MLALVALAAMGCVQFFRKVAGSNRVYGPSYMVISAICIAVFGAGIHIVDGRAFELSLEMTGLASLGGAIAGIGIFSILLAFKRSGEGSVLFPIAGLSVLVAVALSIVVYQEAVTGAKIVGMGLGVISITMLSR